MILFLNLHCQRKLHKSIWFERVKSGYCRCVQSPVGQPSLPTARTPSVNTGHPLKSCRWRRKGEIRWVFKTLIFTCVIHSVQYEGLISRGQSLPSLVTAVARAPECELGEPVVWSCAAMSNLGQVCSTSFSCMTEYLVIYNGGYWCTLCINYNMAAYFREKLRWSKE